MDLIEAAAAPGFASETPEQIRRTDVELVADNWIPPTHWLPHQIRDRSSFRAWQIDPLIIEELSASSAATAEQVRHVAMRLVVEACDVAGPGPCDAKRFR